MKKEHTMPIEKDKNTPTKYVAKCHLTSKNLEDYEPGASRSEVLQFIEKVITSPRTSQKHGKPPVPA